MAGATTTTSGSQDRTFREALLEHLGLDSVPDFTWVLDWVADNIDPSEIYDEKKLDEWARDMGYVKPEEAEHGN